MRSELVPLLVHLMVNNPMVVRPVINLHDLFSCLLSVTLPVHRFLVNTKLLLAMFSNSKIIKVNHIWPSNTLDILLHLMERPPTCTATNVCLEAAYVKQH